MNRRDVLKGLAVASVVPIAAHAASSRRVSCLQGDPGYERFVALGAFRSTWQVYLDGVEQRQVVSADPDAGLVTQHSLNAEGKPYLSAHGEIAMDTRHGVVRVLCNGVEV